MRDYTLSQKPALAPHYLQCNISILLIVTSKPWPTSTTSLTASNTRLPLVSTFSTTPPVLCHVRPSALVKTSQLSSSSLLVFVPLPFPSSWNVLPVCHWMANSSLPFKAPPTHRTSVSVPHLRQSCPLCGIPRCVSHAPAARYVPRCVVTESLHARLLHQTGSPCGTQSLLCLGAQCGGWHGVSPEHVNRKMMAPKTPLRTICFNPFML